MPSQPPRPHHTARNGGDSGAWLLAFLNVILAPSIRSIMWEEMTHSDSQVRGSLHFSVSFGQSWSLWVTSGSMRRRGWGRRDPREVGEQTSLLTHLGAPATQPRAEAVLAAVHSLAGLLLWFLVWSVLFTTRPQTEKGLFFPLCALWAFLSGTQDSCGSSLPSSSSPLLPLLENVCSFWVPSTEFGDSGQEDCWGPFPALHSVLRIVTLTGLSVGTMIDWPLLPCSELHLWALGCFYT